MRPSCRYCSATQKPPLQRQQPELFRVPRGIPPRHNPARISPGCYGRQTVRDVNPVQCHRFSPGADMKQTVRRRIPEVLNRHG